MGTLSSRTIIVTGASRGLGKEMALRFSREGAAVVLTARDQNALKGVAEEAASETLVVPADVRYEDEVRNVIDATEERFGYADTLVNNAGNTLLTMNDGRKPFHDVTEEEWNQIMDVNLKGVFLFTRTVISGMLEGGRGNVINISSGAARKPMPQAAVYACSKWGLEGLTKSLALEYEDAGINVNGLDPGGPTATQIWDHLPEEDSADLHPIDVMNDAAARLAGLEPGEVTGKSMPAQEWEEFFDI